ncbi:MAG: NAD-binding protein [Rhizobiales bacterium]|nr:NAD-binding protein [Hyphomicrobiales bacterium]MBO6698829.1 NAD-binding protein [Hyphomicrobiales bacterium]MBO6734918.1 NAD-binding protein [Hyphomicrobiales bacterium]MBO6911276.1 NAD-binding protein [Hyphomicrobiales bacterium]MBO6955720.1 NAD-binding protein [Hyphomicrobiales bacterium]
MQDKSLDSPKITILGAGSIGVSFAAFFSDIGAHVSLIDPDAERRVAASQGLADQRESMREAGLLRGGAGPVDTLGNLETALPKADLVIECGPENLATKQEIFADLLARSGSETVLATASSAITISEILPNPSQQKRCLVAHPVNPPAILRVIELVPAPGTDQQATAKAASLFQSAGFETVQLGHEIEGFVLNRLQSAVLREAYRLVDEGVTDVAGIETIMRMGLGPRWALSGPFETAELNTPGGIKAHAARMGPAYKRIGEARGETVDWNDALISKVDAQRREVLSLGELAGRATWRSRAVARLVAVRDRLMQD